MARFFRYAFSVLGFIFVLLGMGQASSAAADGPVVRAVLFFSPYCGHCQQVISEDLPPLFRKYGTRLEILGLDITLPIGNTMYEAAVQQFNIQDVGVPALIVGDVVLVGSLDIPQQFPGLIEKYLARGGVDWPDIPGLAPVIAAALPTPTATSVPSPTRVPSIAPSTQPSSVVAPATVPLPSPTRVPSTTPSTQPSIVVVALATAPAPNPTPVAVVPGLTILDHRSPDWRDKLARDPVGNALAIVVLMSMIFVVGHTATIWFGTRPVIKSSTVWQAWVIPVIALIGLGIASYLAYVETTKVAAVCGPVGDCNTVQQSEYARLFGLMPIGVLGVVGYIAILIAWTIYRISRGWIADLAMLALFGTTLAGTLFSIYLTFLEPFVIGATCAWCLSSAVAIAALLWLTTSPSRRAAARLR